MAHDKDSDDRDRHEDHDRGEGPEGQPTKSANAVPACATGADISPAAYQKTRHDQEDKVCIVRELIGVEGYKGDIPPEKGISRCAEDKSGDEQDPPQGIT